MTQLTPTDLDTLADTTHTTIDTPDLNVEVGVHADGDIHIHAEDPDAGIDLKLTRPQALALYGALGLALQR
jgi:hypothetical protein